jgi:dTDP-4-dehydrorhamnose reductase
LRIAIFGSEGQLGSALIEALPAHDVVPVREAEADVGDLDAVRRAVDDARPDCVINAAAMTHVDRCETDPAPAFVVNAIGARNVARAAHAAGAMLVLVSTDYVFDGEKGAPYVETDAPNPLGVYGMTKYAGELFAAEECTRCYVVRTSGLYGTATCVGKGTNFVETMLRLAGERDQLSVVEDERLTPTFADDLAVQIRTLLETPPAPGVYHATNGGECSWYEFAAEIFRLEGIGVKVVGIPASEWETPTRRPANSVLENAALAGAGIDVMPEWRDALSRYLRARRAAG